MPSSNPRFTVRFNPPEMLDKIEGVALSRGISTNELVNQAVDEFLEQHYEQELKSKRIEATEQDLKNKRREIESVLCDMGHIASLRTFRHHNTTGNIWLDLQKATGLIIKRPDGSSPGEDAFQHLYRVYCEHRESLRRNTRIVVLLDEYWELESKHSRALSQLDQPTREWLDAQRQGDDDDDEDDVWG